MKIKILCNYVNQELVAQIHCVVHEMLKSLLKLTELYEK